MVYFVIFNFTNDFSLFVIQVIQISRFLDVIQDFNEVSKFKLFYKTSHMFQIFKHLYRFFVPAFDLVSLHVNFSPQKCH